MGEKIEYIINKIIDKVSFFLEPIANFVGFLSYSTCIILYSFIKLFVYISILLFYILYIFFQILIIFFSLFSESEILRLKKYIKYKILSLNRYGKNMRDFTTWMNFTLLHIYRNTSDHHTNFVRILNFTVGMITLYGATFFCSTTFLTYQYAIFFIPIIFFVPILFMLYLFFVTFNDEEAIYFLMLVLCFVGGCYLFATLSHFHTFSIEMLLLYVISIVIFYHLFTCKIKLIVFTLRLVSYLGLLYIIIAHHQFINPFIGIFSNDKLFESKFEQKLSDLNSSTIINLAKLSQKEFTLQDDYNVSFAELNSAKMVVLSNKNNITALKDENLTKAAEILGDALYSEISQTIEQDRILGDIIKSTSVIYSIILLLCIFSLQKTARKNSIIPS